MIANETYALEKISPYLLKGVVNLSC